jgi:hypothetical protein
VLTKSDCGLFVPQYARALGEKIIVNLAWLQLALQLMVYIKLGSSD